MYIVAIGWLYVVLMMAVASHSVLAGLLRFIFYGLAPVMLLLWIAGTPARRRRRGLPDTPGRPQPAPAGDPVEPEPPQ